MGLFKKAKEKGELVLVFDVGSSSVGGALLELEPSAIPKIIFTVREPMAPEKNINIERFLDSATKALDAVADKIYASRLGAPERVFCFLSPLWHVSQARVIKLEKNTPFIFTPKLADDLIRKEIALFKEEYSTKFSSTESPVRPIEFKNIKIMLNGYETPKPLDQKAKELEMTVFISISPEQVLKKIEATVAKHFQFKDIKFSSFLLASFASARDLYPTREDFLLVNIGGEVTDIAMAKKSALRESASFPLGSNFIVRGVASALRLSLGEASSFISLFKDGHAAEPVARKLELVLNKLRMEWLKSFQQSLAILSSDISIPANIYLVVDKSLADFFSQTIKTEQFNQYTLTESKFSIIFLDAELFHGATTFEEGVIRDPELIIDSIFINRFLK